jgi:hypothetical protein
MHSTNAPCRRILVVFLLFFSNPELCFHHQAKRSSGQNDDRIDRKDARDSDRERTGGDVINQ